MCVESYVRGGCTTTTCPVVAGFRTTMHAINLASVNRDSTLLLERTGLGMHAPLWVAQRVHCEHESNSIHCVCHVCNPMSGFEAAQYILSSSVRPGVAGQLRSQDVFCVAAAKLCTPYLQRCKLVHLSRPGAHSWWHGVSSLQWHTGSLRHRAAECPANKQGSPQAIFVPSANRAAVSENQDTTQVLDAQALAYPGVHCHCGITLRITNRKQLTTCTCSCHRCWHWHMPDDHLAHYCQQRVGI